MSIDDLADTGPTPEEQSRLIPHRPALIAYRGSIAHGTYIPPEDETGIDDVDILSVYVAPLSHYFGSDCKPAAGSDCKIGKWDSAAYEFRHFCTLLANGNPNVLSLLWTEEKHRLLVEREGEALIENRNLFLSKKLYHSFGGYAHAQMKRMESFKDVEDLGCGCDSTFHGETCVANLARGRGSQKRFATGFMGAKRKGLVAKYGYDVKNAAHLIRLLHMGIEVLNSGEVFVDRSGRDADELKSIKRGEWSLGAVKTVAESLFEDMKVARDGSPLPEEPDRVAIDRFMVDTLSVSMMTEVALTGNAALAKKLLT